MDKDLLDKMLSLAKEHPDQCLSLISEIIDKDKCMENDNLIRYYRSMALQFKGLNLQKEKDAWDDEILDLFEKSLSDLRKVGDSTSGINILEGDSELMIDAIGPVLESHRPGKVQQLLGKTKLRYLVEREAVSINTSCADDLIPSNEELKLYGNIFFSFPQIIKSAFVFYRSYDEKLKRNYLCVPLFETESVWNQSGKVNDIAGTIRIYEDGTVTREE